ncbi:4-(cytidine 5'-diphospho)-2-C-methyl-D-erythritol kinase [Rubrobacter taiwanensis]|jgi:4-diphosphocytidyl-2-C-methyl-D-erythritol kinase|uniref:4-diphosphocytidyl-2-C-methyl-D-erythritol kinase n=1 Tax=Rubrobacter taiwanensis TaxID=185139 RepID=A0A4R1BRD0_9ACTN|nr:4-(cytidine 5'-diphospho)-2-C-methyl-D-erythritol kinase [Rubrobacter taiwanensis]TCJ20280.1 4-(cytidine 5'-diphospho)-2-C-methyl-D-erythritol kinase [Rubrobacter taiwanensis]
MTIRLLARAKINYALEVLGSRPDGYHELRTVLQSISLADEVAMRRGGAGFELEVEPAGMDLGPPEANTMRRAWEAICGLAGEELPVRVRVRKRIPPGSGLGGGSADAAAVLFGMNRIYALGFLEEQLSQAGARVGADVPFCLRGGTALGEGIGDRLSVLPAPPPHRLVVVKPPRGASTARIYRDYDAEERDGVESVGPVIEALETGSLNLLAAAIENDLTGVTVKRVPEVGDLKSDLLRAGALGAEMSGTGTAVYGIFASGELARRAAAAVRADFAGVYEPVQRGIERLGEEIK